MKLTLLAHGRSWPTSKSRYSDTDTFPIPPYCADSFIPSWRLSCNELLQHVWSETSVASSHVVLKFRGLVANNFLAVPAVDRSGVKTPGLLTPKKKDTYWRTNPRKTGSEKGHLDFRSQSETLTELKMRLIILCRKFRPGSKVRKHTDTGSWRKCNKTENRSAASLTFAFIFKSTRLFLRRAAWINIERYTGSFTKRTPPYTSSYAQTIRQQWSIRATTDETKIWSKSVFVCCTSSLEQSATYATTDLEHCLV